MRLMYVHLSVSPPAPPGVGVLATSPPGTGRPGLCTPAAGFSCLSHEAQIARGCRETSRFFSNYLMATPSDMQVTFLVLGHTASASFAQHGTVLTSQRTVDSDLCGGLY